MNLYATQVKRELWENKVSYIYAPIVISLLIIVMVFAGALYSKRFIDANGANFVFYSEGGQPANHAVAENTTQPAHFNVITSVMQDSSVFNGMVMGVMYSNCAILYILFSFVLSAYSLRCLFDDRKNRDILFWRSMPVSETTNVLTKLLMVMLIGPLVILVLNLAVTFCVLVFGLIYFGVQGVGIGYLFSSVLNGGALYIPLQIFYELIFSLLMLMPIIGFAFFSSAFAKKTPFFVFITPVLLALVDKILNSLFDINIGIIDLFTLYSHALINTQDAFLLQHAFVFNHTMILPLITCVVMGVLFVAGAIWLRNNRYEI